MKWNQIVSLIVCLTIFLSIHAQVILPHYPDSIFNTYYHQRVSFFKSIPQTQGDIIFLGNSITDGGEWSELFHDVHIKNRGISGDITAGVLHRLDEVAARKPAKVFLLIGVNDLARNILPDSVVKNIFLIADYLHQQSPSTKLFVQSILPVNDHFNMFQGHTNKGIQISEVNEVLKINKQNKPYTFIDLFTFFCNENGKLPEALSNDGLHLAGPGYLLWKHLVYPAVYGLQNKPSLIPNPQNLKWEKGLFSLNDCKIILISDSSLYPLAKTLQNKLYDWGYRVSISDSDPMNIPSIKLGFDKKQVTKEEAYILNVTEKAIVLNAASLHGIFNGIQTLYQLMRDKNFVNACNIIDAPSFTMRGYMVDAARNYQSIKQLKSQVDVMASYKLNIFHFHITEDIAWRLQSKMYPQLTDAKYMQRNPGEYYSMDEMKDLIQYCNERFITLIPEIDMPGHSAAFERAMGVAMQSDKGLEICKNIITEICSELDLPFIHIGGDEVKITNKNFLPEMVTHIRSLGKKVIAWDPGGNVPAGTILQMWNGNAKPKPGYPSLDSRHLYLNHFDPFDGVVTVFNHIIDDEKTGDENHPGAILCNWPDRRVSKEEDAISMNVVYPAMLTFAERCWQGGGWKNFVSDFGKPGSNRYDDFVQFENKLLDHKEQYFASRPFPYFKQSGIEWKMIGPFNNQGYTASQFAPESELFFDTVQLNHYPSLYGATIWLRHFWHPMILSHLQQPHENSTYYAFRKIWADEDGNKNFWIGFNNFSRSTATDEPPAGKWNSLNSAVWVNGKLIEPPIWSRPGQKGNLETPMTDENYELREPVKIFLHKGWNKVLIKCPVSSFKGADWQNPVKWMFTFIEVS
ncbi:MAG: family 20 glycosylhydrolase [Niastella sp.]|nr:family 20 glycosylhydrolase [Niastella sp.]